MRPVLYLSVLALALFFHPVLSAQNPGCNGIRYKQDITSSVKKTTLQYSLATNAVGVAMNLSMDVYEPDGDTTSKRPVIILAHGGSFVFGNKSDMAPQCELLAKRGYVAASIQYRLFPIFLLGFPDSIGLMDAAVKAVGDMKSAVRFFRNDATTANQFRADTNHIFIGGYSAGAITALHAAYLDENDNIPSFIQSRIIANGGIKGNSGPANKAYSSEVHAVINMSGGLYRSAWINDGDLPVSSIHGTEDGTVYFTSGYAANTVYLEGSSLLHIRAQDVGTWSYLKKVPGAGHSDLYSEPAYATTVYDYWKRTTALLEFLTCFTDTLPEITTGIHPAEPALVRWALYPNPAQQDVAFVRLPAGIIAAQAVLYDISGREVIRIDGLSPGENRIPLAGVPAGVYILRLWDTALSGVDLGARQFVVR